MGEVYGEFVNVDEALAYIKSLSDPVEQEVLWTAYATLLFGAGLPLHAGKFDVHFLMRILVEMLKDRERLTRVLSGDLSDESV